MLANAGYSCPAPEFKNLRKSEFLEFFSAGVFVNYKHENLHSFR